jgi:hypothetical protein
MSIEPRPLRDLAGEQGFSAADVAFLTGLAESTISRLWDYDDWLDRTRGPSLQTLIAVIPGLGDYVCDLSLTSRRRRLIDNLEHYGVTVDTDRFHHAVASGTLPEQDLATALEAALHVMRGDDRRATAHLARFWGLRQDHALALVYGPDGGGLLVDRAPFIEASIALADRLAARPHAYHSMVAQANLAHQVAKATGNAPDQARRSPVDRQSALAFRSATMGLIIETNDPETAQHYSNVVARSSVLALVEGWTFPCYTRDVRPTADLSVPQSIVLRRTANEILRELDVYNDAYLDYLVATGIPVVLRRDPTFGLRAADLVTAIERRMDNRPTSPPATAALLDSLKAETR